VVAYPGWFVHKVEGTPRSDVWVVEPKAIGAFLKYEPTVLTDQDVTQIVYFLKRYVRNRSDVKQESWST
jgi:hypothetical protein